MFKTLYPVEREVAIQVKKLFKSENDVVYHEDDRDLIFSEEIEGELLMSFPELNELISNGNVSSSHGHLDEVVETVVANYDLAIPVTIDETRVVEQVMFSLGLGMGLKEIETRSKLITLIHNSVSVVLSQQIAEMLIEIESNDNLSVDKAIINQFSE